MKTYFIIAIRNLIQARRRTGLLCAALGMVSMLLVLLLSLSQGMSETMLRSATTLVTGHVNIAGFYKAKPGDSAALIQDTEKLKQIAKDNIEGLDYVTDRGRGWGKIISETGTTQVAMASVNIDDEPGLVSQIRLAPEADYIDGGGAKTPGNVDDLRGNDTILIFAGQARRLQVRVGDTITLNTETFRGSVNTIDVRIVAIAKDIGMLSNWNIFVPHPVLNEVYTKSPKTTGAIHVYLKDHTQSDAVMEKLRHQLSAAGYELMEHAPSPFWAKFETVQGEDWTGQKLDLTIWKDEVSFLQWAISALDGLSFFLVAILLVIIIVGVINTMAMAVRERTREIGTLRAIGMRRRQVMLMFMVEAMLLGLFGTTLGTTLGALLSLGMDAAQITIPNDAVQAILMSETLQLSVQPGQMFNAIITLTFFTILAAVSPAFRAARMQPVTAIHKIG